MRAMTIPVLGFSHVCIAVSDAERSLAFYRDVLGFEVFFDVALEGPSLEAVTGEAGAKGRMIGGMIGGAVVELLEFGHRDLQAGGGHARLGYTNISFSVADLDAAYATATAKGVTTGEDPVDIGGVRMFFVQDPDGTAIELVEFPNREKTSAEMWGFTPRQ
jgi:glyoxylase I family protein